jgi:hypothetical protein
MLTNRLSSSPATFYFIGNSNSLDFSTQGLQSQTQSADSQSNYQNSNLLYGTGIATDQETTDKEDQKAQAKQIRNCLGIIASFAGLIGVGLLSRSGMLGELEAIEGPLVILLDLITSIFTAYDLIPFAEQIGQVFHKLNQSISSLISHPVEAIKNLASIALPLIFAVNWFKNHKARIINKEVPPVAAFHIIRAHLTNAVIDTPIAFGSWFARTSLVKIFSSISVAGGVRKYLSKLKSVKLGNLSFKHEFLNVIPSFAFLKARPSQSLLYLVLAALTPLRGLLVCDVHEVFDAISSLGGLLHKKDDSQI